MKIGVNTLFLVPGDVGGTEVYLRQTLGGMAHNHPDVQFALFTNKENDRVFREDLGDCPNVMHTMIPVRAANRPRRIIAEQILLPIAVSRVKPDLLWSPGYTAPWYAPCLQSVTIHDLQYKSYPEDMQWLERWTLDFLVKLACNRCDHVIAVSDFSRQELLRHGFAEESKIDVVYEGVNPVFGQFREDGVSRIAPDIPPKTPYLLCVAHTYPHKMVHLLIEAFGQVKDQIPHHLVIVGKARRGEPMVARALERQSPEPRIHRLQDVQFEQLIAAYQGAEIFVLPSVYEGFGLPILEAMLAGTPVITTAKASLPEVGGAHAVYVDSPDADSLAVAILNTLDWSEGQRRRRVRAARDWASSFSWDRSARETITLFSRLAEGVAGGRDGSGTGSAPARQSR